MALQNPSFEEAGVLPGEAAHWILTVVTSLEEVAGFGVPERGSEDFEGWWEFAPSLDAVSTTRAFFELGSQGFEAFESGWVTAFQWELPVEIAAAPLGSDNVEGYESGWSNSEFLESWDDVLSALGVFDGEAREDFEDAWRSNQTFAWSWSDVTSASAMFDGGMEAFEDFESGWTL